MHRTTTSEGPRIGELAERAGLTARTLHHYDQIGLVRALERTEAGHRRYSGPDVRRLYQVVALRSLGVPLARIARRLEGDGFTMKDAVTAQLEVIDAELLHARRLRRRLERILEVLEHGVESGPREAASTLGGTSGEGLAGPRTWRLRRKDRSFADFGLVFGMPWLVTACWSTRRLLCQVQNEIDDVLSLSGARWSAAIGMATRQAPIAIQFTKKLITPHHPRSRVRSR